MKDTEYIDIFATEVGDSVLPVEQNANAGLSTRIVQMPHLRKLEQQVSPVENPTHHLVRCVGFVAGDVLVDLP
jgi:hypothetical protein